jgi:hypothetical protein
VSLTQYYTATSVDGFIADPDNSLDWLFTRKREDDGPLPRFAGLLQSPLTDSNRRPPPYHFGVPALLHKCSIRCHR